ncbi:MAG: hypothetical protein OHK0017_01420 [Patescibacteria group bacterium]
MSNPDKDSRRQNREPVVQKNLIQPRVLARAMSLGLLLSFGGYSLFKWNNSKLNQSKLEQLQAEIQNQASLNPEEGDQFKALNYSQASNQPTWTNNFENGFNWSDLVFPLELNQTETVTGQNVITTLVEPGENHFNDLNAFVQNLAKLTTAPTTLQEEEGGLIRTTGRLHP